VFDVQVREAHFLDLGILEQIIGTGRALEAGPEYEHSHVMGSPCGGNSVSLNVKVNLASPSMGNP
jgi:hypothetical protein